MVNSPTSPPPPSTKPCRPGSPTWASPTPARRRQRTRTGRVRRLFDLLPLPSTRRIARKQAESLLARLRRRRPWASSGSVLEARHHARVAVRDGLPLGSSAADNLVESPTPRLDAEGRGSDHDARQLSCRLDQALPMLAANCGSAKRTMSPARRFTSWHPKRCAGQTQRAPRYGQPSSGSPSIRSRHRVSKGRSLPAASAVPDWSRPAGGQQPSVPRRMGATLRGQHVYRRNGPAAFDGRGRRRVGSDGGGARLGACGAGGDSHGVPERLRIHRNPASDRSRLAGRHDQDRRRHLQRQHRRRQRSSRCKARARLKPRSAAAVQSSRSTRARRRRSAVSRSPAAPATAMVAASKTKAR